MRRYPFLILILAAAAGLQAVESKTVVYDSKSDFERGKLQGIAVTADGRLMPAPLLRRIYESDESTIWAAAADSKGRLYLSVGNQGRVVRCNADGRVEQLFDAEEPLIFALAVWGDRLYAGASPGGKIYEIAPDGRARLFFDTGAEYAWALLPQGKTLLAATGLPAKIFRIDDRGNGSLLFQGEERHVRTMAAGDGVLYFGTARPGRVYRLLPDGRPIVHFDPQMDEVLKLVESEGFLYAAAVKAAGERRGEEKPSAEAEESDEEGEASDAFETSRGTVGLAGGLFRISREGYGKDLWLGVGDRLQTIASYEKGTLLVGGSRVHTLNARGELSTLIKPAEMQVTAFLQVGHRRLMITAEPARVYEMTADKNDSATYESEVIDAGLSARWGKLICEGNDQGRRTRFFTRSGNTEKPSATWSDWQPVRPADEGFDIESPAARFLQWKCLLGDRQAVIDKVSLSYAQFNQPPEIIFIQVHPSDEVYEAEGADSGHGIVFPAALGNKQTKRGYRCVDWSFEDPNLDRLLFSLYYRRTNERLWRRLAEKLSTNVHSWDASSMADGWYEIKVTASDSLSNPPGEALRDEQVSKPFLVDNTAPTVRNWRIDSSGGKRRLTFQVYDEYQTIRRVQLSIDAGEWRNLFPEDGVMDAQVESFRIELPDAGDPDIAVRTEDKSGNKTVFFKK